MLISIISKLLLIIKKIYLIFIVKKYLKKNNLIKNRNDPIIFYNINTLTIDITVCVP